MAVRDVNRGRGGGGCLRAADEQLRFRCLDGARERLRLRDDREKVSKACESRACCCDAHILHTLLLSSVGVPSVVVCSRCFAVSDIRTVIRPYVYRYRARIEDTVYAPRAPPGPAAGRFSCRVALRVSLHPGPCEKIAIGP